MSEGASPSRTTRVRSLFFAVGVTAGRAAFRRAAPFYFAVAIACGLAFGGNGMDAADLTALLRRSTPLRLSFWGLWLVGSLPAAQAILGEPRLFFLRTLPVSRAQVLGVHAVFLGLAELPWIVLHARGEGMLSGLAVLWAAVALHAWLVARLRPRLALAAVAAVFASLLWPLAPGWLLVASVPLLGLALPTAYARAPERAASAGPTLITPRLGAVLSLALAYVLLLGRGQRPLLLRGVLLCLLSAAIAALAIRNNAVVALDQQNTLSLGLVSVPLLLSLVSLAGPGLRAEAQLDWLLATAGLDGRRRVLALTVALAMLGVLLSFLHGVVLALWLDPPAAALPRLLGLPVVLGPLAAAVAQACLRLTAQGTAKDSDRLLLLLLAVIPLCIVSAWLFHEALLLPWALAAFVGTEASVRCVLPTFRFERLRSERARRAGDDL
ncbi:MAG: hypothetical protein JNJ46_21865 [Myxococcales bacterium]|nr:hypothetical protein [Myxococcales bacterium]